MTSSRSTPTPRYRTTSLKSKRRLTPRRRTPMRVLGVDPGLARTGVAVVEGSPGHLVLVHASCIETVPQTNEAVRLATLFDLVVDACASLRPDVAAVEELFFSTNRRTAMRVSEARGVILCALARAGRRDRRVHADTGQGGGVRLRRRAQTAGRADGGKPARRRRDPRTRRRRRRVRRCGVSSPPRQPRCADRSCGASARRAPLDRAVSNARAALVRATR